MSIARMESQLAALGFEIDWTSTIKIDGYWSGAMDAIGRYQIDGDCRGEAIDGDTKAGLVRNALNRAREYAKHGPNAPCTKGYCEFHD